VHVEAFVPGWQGDRASTEGSEYASQCLCRPGGAGAAELPPQVAETASSAILCTGNKNQGSPWLAGEAAHRRRKRWVSAARWTWEEVMV
jgi:hypothetical protein